MSDAVGTVAIRAAMPGDARALARLHVAVWRATYADVAPADAFAVLDEAHRLPGWQAHLDNQLPGAGTLIAQNGSATVGFIRYGPASQPELGEVGEIKHLYIAREYAGKGIGTKLLQAGLRALASAGHGEVALAVVATNAPALAFYRAQGAQVAGAFHDAGPLWKSENLILRWVLDGERA